MNAREFTQRLADLLHVLPRFFGLSRREAEELAVSIKPAAVIPRRGVVTQVRVSVPALCVVPQDSSKDVDDDKVSSIQFRPAEVTFTASNEELSASAEPLRLALPPRDSVEPLDAKVSRIHVTVSKVFLAKLEAARDALSHSHRGSSDAEILEAGLDLILAAQEKRNGLVEKPLKTPRPSKPGHIPAHVRRAVWERDGGRCQFRLDSGEICGSTYLVEVDHIQPEALGGAATFENCRLACFGHNQLAARRVFGDEHMDRFGRRRTETGRAREPEAAYAVPVARGPRTRSRALA